MHYIIIITDKYNLLRYLQVYLKICNDKSHEELKQITILDITEKNHYILLTVNTVEKSSQVVTTLY